MTTNMAISTGERMPHGSFGIMGKSGPGSISTEELFSAKKVVLISVPGAFTPTCSMSHLPGFVEHADEILSRGVDTIACMAVNDVFVMTAWGNSQNVGNKVLMLADGNGDYTRSLGLELDATTFSMGWRGQRFAIVVEDGIATHVAVEEPASFDVSRAESILKGL
jgi:peroxiredoxin